MGTTTPAARVARHRAELARAPRPTDTDAMRVAYDVIVGSCTDMALAAIEQGEATEAVAWATLAEVTGYRLRRSF